MFLRLWDKRDIWTKADEQKPISWEDPLPLPRSNSISNANVFNSQSVTRKSSNSIISFPQRHNSYNLNSVNNNQETSFYNQQEIFNLNSLLNNNHLINNNSSSNNSSDSASVSNNSSVIVTSSSPVTVIAPSQQQQQQQQQQPEPQNQTHKKLEHTPSARSTVSSEDSWCPSEEHDADDISSYNDDDDNLSERSNSLISTRTSQLRLTFNKAKQHLSLDKWRNNSTNSIMPSTTNSNSHNSQADSPGEPMSRLTRWWSMRRGSHQYDLSNPNSPNRSGSIDKDGDEKSNGKKMPLLQETEEDHSQVDGLNSLNKMDRRTAPLVMPPAPTNLTPLQLKRRHIISAIVHSENSYILSLERLVKDYKKPLEESNPPIMNNSKTSILFHRVPEILQCHLLLRIALSECIRNWDRDEKIGDVFISFMTQSKGAFSKTHVLDVYSGFINNFSNAMDLAKVETKRKSAFADFLNVKQISAHDRLSFFGLMVKPVQRFPQFILFLQDLLKHTPQGHHDRMALQMALTQLESLADSLNERKREAEQYQAYKEMLSQISGTFNTRFLSSSGSADQRHNYLLREDNVTQLEFGQNGSLVKTKARRLLLANDKVICVSVSPKQDFGASEKFSLKWMYHVNDVQIVDNQASATLSRYITSGLNRGGSLKSNHSGSGNESSFSHHHHPYSQTQNSQFENGVDLANDMSVLMHDFNLMSRVHDLIGQLKGEYVDINTNITKNVLNTIQSSIRKKDEEMAWVDSCCLQLIVKQKSGKEETFTFRTNDPSVKKEWITELRLAQLALDCNNSPAWEQSDRDNHRPLTKMPLFVKMHPVHKSTQHQTEVRCGCYYAMSPELKFQKRATKNRYYLWVCSVDGSGSHITILMHQPNQSQAMIKDVAAFSLNDIVITSVDYVRGRIDVEESEVDCIWIGTSNKKLFVYAGNSPEQERQIAQMSIPDTPTQILYHISCDKTFIALANGDILMYRKDEDVWNVKQYQVIKLDESKTITSMISIYSNVYVACGKRIYVLNGNTGELQKSFEVQQASNDVNMMAHAGVGLWISLKNSSVICLYHIETFKHLQDINISHNILRVTSKSETPSNNSLSTVYVTALMACKGLLWVGTNVGFTLTVPLPRLEGLPIISGNINISYHAHLGPVTFFLPLITKTALQQNSSSVSKAQTAAKIEANHDNEMNHHNEQNDQQIKKQQNGEKEEVVKLEKQRSLDITPSPAKFKAQLPNSPIVLRRKSNIRESDLSRISKTLPRGLSGISSFLNGSNSMRSSSSSGSSANNSDSGCDVYGLYSDLLFVKEDFDGQMTLTPMTAMSLHEQAYESLRRGSSDPDLAAIPSKVSTLDRRLKMKTGRPRSLDLSNWSVDSRSSSLFSSSGSEESMGIKYRSVSRNSSNASASQKFNGGELVNINECEGHQIQATSTPTKNEEAERKETTATPNTQVQFNTATMKTTKRKNLKNNHHQQLVDGRRTVLVLNGGRGYVNWRHIWSPSGSSGNTNSNHSNSNADSRQLHMRSNSITMPKSQYSTEGHIIIWEKKL
ncbi:hypothetical protein PVAND_011963 [Polypedilum vanderplanki]|uniref:DH domain-containing protein n=1 Tax=Polypedilum vanderplanki TaxID=319348 RepID=A0A9J6CKZ4_POLVA|nr:hypothetical protein PVAND_011963 [Polypedilum vanderplanki]